MQFKKRENVGLALCFLLSVIVGAVILCGDPLSPKQLASGITPEFASSCDHHMPPGVHRMDCVDEPVTHEGLLIEASKGNAWKQIDLANEYYYGRGGMKVDYGEAVKWYLKAANSDNQPARMEAEVYLGYTYAQGGNGISKDYQKAVKWYLKAAEEGSDDAYLFLGHLYEDGGPGFPRDFSEAYFWYSFPTSPMDTITRKEFVARQLSPAQRSAVENRVLEWKRTHNVPFRPLGTAPKAAFEKIRQKAEHGESPSQWSLGDAYFDGRGVEQNYEEAYFWFLLAKKGGFHMDNFPPPIEWHLTPQQIVDVERRVDAWKPAEDSQLARLSKPLGRGAVADWAEKAVVDALTFSYADYKQHFRHSAQYFTQTGYAMFMSELRRAHFTEEAIALKEEFRALPKAVPKVVKEGVNDKDRYYWYLDLDIELVHKNENAQGSEAINLQLLVERSGESWSQNGLVISEWRNPDAVPTDVHTRY